MFLFFSTYVYNSNFSITRTASGARLIKTRICIKVYTHTTRTVNCELQLIVNTESVDKDNRIKLRSTTFLFTSFYCNAREFSFFQVDETAKYFYPQFTVCGARGKSFTLTFSMLYNTNEIN